ncbi:zf-HC2 domain-containing protein [Paenibacillus sp. 1011MAR3C5]|uniref:zf-HC2 domain-containing protein n=1 Tax=Paenibacillus sp. 1011MAR3C5 TaxID=1675787 RepID=UPI000E6D17D8|nr:zf-HC2 domain-containing protein [Paenibacillus sp. 1011MAR3C5]RJE83328.1 zf-HC2 domain-containing protein [Paenibacillus sp. 1011MAR3C5]
MKVTSDVIRDLIPLVKDGVASSDSVALVDHYMKKDPAMRAEYDSYGKELPERDVSQDQRILAAIKRGVVMTQLFVLLVGAIIGIAMTGSFGMFYNLIIMPFVGALAVFSLKRGWSLAMPLIVFVASYLYQFINSVIRGGWDPIVWGTSLPYSGIYALLTVMGVVIGLLLQYAFQKGSRLG